MGARLLELRHAIRDRLDGRTAALDRVSTNRADKVWQSGLPAICIYTDEEEDERDSVAPPSYWCTARIVVHILLEGEDSLPMDDALDELGEQVSQLLKADPTLRDLAQWGYQVRWQVTVKSDGDQLFAGGKLTWEFKWHEDAPTGDPAALTPWKWADSKFSLDPSA